MEAMLTVKDVAAEFKLSISKIYHLAESGKLRGAKIGNRAWRFRREDIESFLNLCYTPVRRDAFANLAGHKKPAERQQRGVGQDQECP